MDTNYEKPRRFGAYIYKTELKDKEQYLIFVKAEGKERPKIRKRNMTEYDDSQKYMNLRSINRWISKKSDELRAGGNKVKVRYSNDYKMANLANMMPSAKNL